MVRYQGKRVWQALLRQEAKWSRNNISSGLRRASPSGTVVADYFSNHEDKPDEAQAEVLAVKFKFATNLKCFRLRYLRILDWDWHNIQGGR